MATGGSPGMMGRVATSAWRPSTASCSCAAGRRVSSEAISTRLRSRVLRRSAILAVVVVLPEPWRPTIITTTGGRGVQIDADAGPAQGLDQRVMDDLHHHLAGGDALEHALADGLLAHRGEEIAHHRQGDIGLEQGDAHFAQAASTSASVSAPRRVSRPKTSPNRSVSFSNIANPLQPIAKTRKRPCARLADGRGPSGPNALPKLRRAELSRGAARSQPRAEGPLALAAGEI